MTADTKSYPLARQVVAIRYWQHVVNEHLKKGILRPAVHLAFGHEAIAAAVSAAMGPDDQLALTHRNIAYNLARAGRLQPIYDEYLRLPSGVGHGHLGTMNIADPNRGVAYTSAILGNNMPVAVGLSLAQQVQNREGIVTVLTGDGAMEEGTFYESHLIASSQRLRCLFLVENNDHALASTIAERRRPIHLEHFCRAFDVPYARLAGNDVFTYATQLRDLFASMRQNPGPACIEVELALLNRHAGPTPGWPTDPMQVDFRKGLLLTNDTTDPLYALSRRLGEVAYRELEREILAEGWEL
jgi:pyruvate dehydrogenase E1 component alpha subunit